MAKRTYEKPVLEYCGEMKERTLGGGGSGFDGGPTSKTHTGGGVSEECQRNECR